MATWTGTATFVSKGSAVFEKELPCRFVLLVEWDWAARCVNSMCPLVDCTQDTTFENDRAGAVRFLGWLSRAHAEVPLRLSVFAAPELGEWVEEYCAFLQDDRGCKSSTVRELSLTMIPQCRSATSLSAYPDADGKLSDSDH
eukprot:2959568-Prymnesium_polylepis.1